ncbi:MAG: lysoplasmalogenase [Polyangiaceae bacterium]
MTAAGSLGLLVAERQKSQLGSWLTKPVAALGFVLLGLVRATYATPYDAALVVGLCLCMGGDVLLIPKQRAAFAAGILSFLLGHVAFVVAFWQLGVSKLVGFGAFFGLLLPAAVVLRWLLPHAGNLRIAVVAYVVVITTMVATAFAVAHSAPWGVYVGAVMFYFSDLAVARERFVKPSFFNRLWGTPLYFAAMLVIAHTLPGAGHP